MVRVQCIQDLSRFPALAQAWDAMVLASPQPSPMLLSDWIICWMECFGPRADALVFTAWEGDRLVGGLPLCHRVRRAGPLPVYEEVRFIGVHPLGGLYMDMVLPSDADPSQNRQIARALFQALGACGLWDRLRLERMLPQSRLATLLREDGPWPGTLLEAHPGVACPVLPLPDTMDALAAGMDPVFRSMLLRKNLKLAPARHRVEFIPAIAKEDIDRDLDRFFEVHTRRWNAQGRRGEFARPATRAFYHAVSHRLADKGMLRLSKLLLDGEGHSFEYGVHLGTQYFALQAGVSLEGLECQAGTYHMYHIVEHLLPHASHYHFMEGGESYKYKWGSAPQAVQDVHVWSGVKGRVLQQLRRLGSRLRSLRAAAASASAGIFGWVDSLPDVLSWHAWPAWLASLPLASMA